MSRIELTAELLIDFDRFLEHLSGFAVENAEERIAEIVQAVDVLGRSPLIGRKTTGGRRELVIGRGARGYVALYQFEESIDTVFVLAIRAQRESRYRR